MQAVNIMHEWVTDQLKTKEIDLKNILGWEDDGGLVAHSDSEN